MPPVLWVAIGSALGGVGRYLIGRSLDARWQDTAGHLSVGTLAVNIVGSFLIAALLPWCGEERMRAFVLFGLMGGFTTFSSFSLHTMQFLQQNAWDMALLNVGLSVSCCLLAAWAGLRVAQTLA